jgi:hypothetical protein
MKRGIMRGCGVCAAMFWLLLKITSWNLGDEKNNKNSSNKKRSD